MNLNDLIAQKEALEQKIKEMKKTEAKAALAKARELIEQFDLTEQELFGKGGRKSSGPVAAKYRDPQTGQTWSGRGRAPKWLEGKNKDDYAI